MARDPKYDVLFEPVRIGPKVLKNRFFQVAQCSGARTEYPGFQAYHRGIRAEGGWAAVCTESVSIDPSSDGASAQIWDDGDVRNLAAMTERVHRFDALAAIELRHGGIHSTNPDTRDIPVAPTATPSPADLTLHARSMDLDDIRRAREMYVAAALRAREAGFDVIEIYGGHGQLPFQFLSPFWNQRTDGYGGSFEHRARFWREVLADVRAAVGDECAIAARLSLDELRGPRGLQFDGDGLRFVELCDELVDLWDVVVGGFPEWGQNASPSRFFGEDEEAPFVGRMKAAEHTDKPVMGVGRFTDPDTMLALVRSGRLDVIGAARPSISDPFLPEKIAEGRHDDIRACIGCNQCVARYELGGRIVCTQNATAGEEYRRGWHPERFSRARNADRSVLVVGAGPAGMECSMVLGKRGMSSVQLVDRAPEPGGCLTWITRLGHSDGQSIAPRGAARGLGEFGRLTDYRLAQIGKLANVELSLGAHMTAEQILAHGADIVIVATGCDFATDGMNPVTRRPIDGVDAGRHAWQLTPRDVVLRRDAIGERVLVFDTDGYFMGATIAQTLAGEGRKVDLVTPDSVPMRYMEATLEAPMMRRDLVRLGVEIHTDTMLDAVEAGACQTSSVWGGDRRRTFEVDTVVLCTERLGHRTLYDELRADPARLASAGVEAVYLIGDAAAPRMLHHAIFDGHRLAREIDSADPSVPLPYIRERRLWGRTSNEDYDAQLLHEPDVVATEAIAG